MRNFENDKEILLELITFTEDKVKLSANLVDSTSKEKPSILKDWYIRINAISTNYWASLVGLREGINIISKDIPPDHFTYIITSTVYRTIFDHVNSFEYFTELLRLNSDQFQNKLNELNKNLLDSLTLNWNVQTRNDKDRKNSHLKFVGNNIKNQELKRTALNKLHLLDEEDITFLRFIWGIRNTIHNDYLITKEMSYTLKYYNNTKAHTYNYKKGSYLSHDGEAILIPMMADKLANIMMNLIKNLKDLNNKDIKYFEI